MSNILSIYRRMKDGEMVSQEFFDIEIVYSAASELCAKYKIEYDPQNPVPADDDMANRVFQAGLEFFHRVGVYFIDTHRIIRFTEDEIAESLIHVRDRCIIGEGKDQAVFSPRKPDSDAKLWHHVGTGIMCTDERVAFNLVNSYASIEQANSISAPALVDIQGQQIVSGTPLEIYGAIRGVEIARAATRHAGRPGIGICNCISTAGSAIATIAASSPPFGLRPSDGWLVAVLAEMKINMSSLNKVAYLKNLGANVAIEVGPLVGGYAGGPAETAVVAVASMFIGLLIFQCDYALCFPLQIARGCSSHRQALWASAVSAQAISLNIDLPTLFLGYISAGPMTKQFFYETAAYVAAIVPSGVSAQTTHPAKAVLNDHVTPLEMLGSVRLAESCRGMRRAEANEIVKSLLTKYEANLSQPPAGKRYQDCYDIDTGEPDQEYLDMFAEVMDELKLFGFH